MASKKGISAEKNARQNRAAEESGAPVVDKKELKEALLHSYAQGGHPEVKRKRIRERLKALGVTVPAE